jgi:hypothetical protein
MSFSPSSAASPTSSSEHGSWRSGRSGHGYEYGASPTSTGRKMMQSPMPPSKVLVPTSRSPSVSSSTSSGYMSGHDHAGSPKMTRIDWGESLTSVEDSDSVRSRSSGRSSSGRMRKEKELPPMPPMPLQPSSNTNKQVQKTTPSRHPALPPTADMKFLLEEPTLAYTHPPFGGRKHHHNHQNEPQLPPQEKERYLSPKRSKSSLKSLTRSQSKTSLKPAAASSAGSPRLERPITPASATRTTQAGQQPTSPVLGNVLKTVMVREPTGERVIPSVRYTFDISELDTLHTPAQLYADLASLERCVFSFYIACGAAC